MMNESFATSKCNEVLLCLKKCQPVLFIHQTFVLTECVICSSDAFKMATCNTRDRER